MTKRMLIDGTHAEEMRVVITSAKRLEEYDVETSTKRQFKGNIYLAKVTRVEPSLQAAFVDFGGDRHGFLAFNDIHPDYFQIPVEDRAALVAAENAEGGNESAAQALVDEIDSTVEEVSDTEAPDADEADAAEDEPDSAIAESAGAPAAGIVATDPAEGEDAPESEQEQPDGKAEDVDDTAQADAAPSEETEDGSGPETEDDENGAGEKNRPSSRRRRRGRKRNEGDGNGEAGSASRRSWRYKIQEVIKRNQIILVQVVKEERGNKGAALTTYISLAGRYCVLMPNTARGGGISRKITSPNARRKLKKIIDDLEIQNGMGVIMRTAGTERSKAEIKRDFEYLTRTWDDVRERTLNSIAPTPVYEDASLIKRAIRDLYTRDVEEVLVDGVEAYQTAKKFMRMLMPSHAKRVQRYRETDIPLFHRYQIEGQLDAIHSAVVQLKSGGYVVIQATEALVSIDVNSGRSTRERNIEETAVNTNIEAAEEIARQLRLRDLAGLVVIDFIDMQETRHLRQVERRLKESMKADRARIQIGRISGFGLLELSRQRLRPSLQEASTQTCPHCRGAGFVRLTESMALQVLRALEEEGIRHRLSEVTIAIPGPVALYVLNNKRAMLTDIENRYGFRVTLLGDDSVIPPDMRIERVRASASEAAESAPAVEAEAKPGKAEEAAPQEESEKKRPRRRRSRRKPSAEAVAETPPDEVANAAQQDETAESGHAESNGAADEQRSSRRRPGRRGGRRRSGRSSRTTTGRPDAEKAEPDASGAAAPKPDGGSAAEPQPTSEPPTAPEPEPVSAPEPQPEPAAIGASDPEPAPALAVVAVDGVRGAPAAPASEAQPAVAAESDRPKRRGWWQKIVK